MADRLHQHTKAITTTDALEAHTKKSFTVEFCNFFQSGITLQSGFNGYKCFNIMNDSRTQTELIKNGSKNAQRAAWPCNQVTWGAREESAWSRQLARELQHLCTASEAEMLNWEKAGMKILAHSGQNVDLCWHYSVVNWVSELLQTAAVSTLPYCRGCTCMCAFAMDARAFGI